MNPASATNVASLAQRSGKARWVVLAVALMLAAFVIVLATRPAADTVASNSNLVGSPAPPISGTALDGRAVNLSSMRGRYVVVNFFATWCVPCRNEHPELKAFTNRNVAAGSPQVVAVAYDRNDLSAARSFFAQQGGSWPVIGEGGSRVAVDYGVRGLPESYIVDPQGRIAAHITGEVTADQLDRLTGISA